MSAKCKPVGGTEYNVGVLPKRKKAWIRAEKTKPGWLMWWNSLNGMQKFKAHLENYLPVVLLKEEMKNRSSVLDEIVKSSKIWSGTSSFDLRILNYKRRRGYFRMKKRENASAPQS